jgi:hypothetical protein
MGAETQRKRFPPSTEVERVVSHFGPAIESAPLRLAKLEPWQRRNIKYSQQLPRPLGTAKYLIIPSRRAPLGLAIGLKNDTGSGYNVSPASRMVDGVSLHGSKEATETRDRLCVSLGRSEPRRAYESARSYQRSTRKARKVFHRLGRPSASSISTSITPG